MICCHVSRTTNRSTQDVSDDYKNRNVPPSNIMEQSISQHLYPMMDDGIRANLIQPEMIRSSSPLNKYSVFMFSISNIRID
ncbi:unnamed protein product [Onchocerca flexuosa]|uniref:AC4 n=1 Tax=Onchocerca flexuosa TaxID=387005 RepID=A0A183HXE5_9BILA|nr:unnamed protein product [Onchocerca flexuosa]